MVKPVANVSKQFPRHRLHYQPKGKIKAVRGFAEMLQQEIKKAAHGVESE